MNGTVYLVGAGPGTADLLTVKAARLISQANVILYDALICRDVLDLAPQARKIAVGKRAGRASTDQSFINRLLVASARDGNMVVRLKGGDPMIFGRAHEEIRACRQAGIDVEVVPGVTAASAAAAQIGVSLTQRCVSRSLSFVTPSVAHDMAPDTTWADAAVASHTSAIYMGTGMALMVRDTLLAKGLRPDLPIALVHDVGRPEAGHRAGQLSDLLELVVALGDGPTILLIGDVLDNLKSASTGAQTQRARHG